MPRGVPEITGAAVVLAEGAWIWEIIRTDSGYQRNALRASSTWDWVWPQPLSGSLGMSFWPVALISTTCGGITARAGQKVPGARVCAGRRRALSSLPRELSERCRVAVTHRPLPEMTWAPFTHRSALTAAKDAGRDCTGVLARQPTQGGGPAWSRRPGSWPGRRPWSR